MGHLLGYARVSTTDQQPQLQVDALKGAGCYRVFTETASGARTDRPVLEQVLDQLPPGDTLVVWKLDRLGRSLRRLVDTRHALANAAARSLRRWSRPEHNCPLGTAVVPCCPLLHAPDRPQGASGLGEELVGRVLVVVEQPGFGDLAVADVG